MNSPEGGKVAKQNSVCRDLCPSESGQTVLITLDCLFHSSCDNSHSYLHSVFYLWHFSSNLNSDKRDHFFVSVWGTWSVPLVPRESPMLTYLLFSFYRPGNKKRSWKCAAEVHRGHHASSSAVSSTMFRILRSGVQLSGLANWSQFCQK